MSQVVQPFITDEAIRAIGNAFQYLAEQELRSNAGWSLNDPGEDWSREMPNLAEAVIAQRDTIFTLLEGGYDVTYILPIAQKWRGANAIFQCPRGPEDVG